MEIASSVNTDERYCPGNLTMAKMDEWRKILEKNKTYVFKGNKRDSILL